MKIQALHISDYEEVFALWKQDPYIGLSSSDEKEQIARFLQRNPGLNYIAVHDSAIVGTILCGQDGRRGYIHHLYVSPAFRNQGVAAQLIDTVLKKLASIQIPKCHIFVYTDNKEGCRFWEKKQWSDRVELKIYSKDI